jgi:hypothetical protein
MNLLFFIVITTFKVELSLQEKSDIATDIQWLLKSNRRRFSLHRRLPRRLRTAAACSIDSLQDIAKPNFVPSLISPIFNQTNKTNFHYFHKLSSFAKVPFREFQSSFSLFRKDR